VYGITESEEHMKIVNPLMPPLPFAKGRRSRKCSVPDRLRIGYVIV